MENNNENNDVILEDITKEESASSVGDKNQKKELNKKIILFIAIVVVVLIIMGILLFLLGSKDEKKANNDNNSTSTNITTTKEASEGMEIAKEDFDIIKEGTNYTVYNLVTTNSLNKGRVYTTLDNGAKIAIDVLGEPIPESEGVSHIDKLDFYINDKVVFTIANTDDLHGFNISTIGNYIIVNKNIDGTYFRSEHHIVYDTKGNLVKDLGDFNADNLSGMVVGEGNEDFVDEMGLFENEIVFIGTRYVDRSSVIIDNKDYYFLCDAEFKDHDKVIGELKKMSPSLAVLSEYHYEIKNGVIDFDNPKINVLETLSDVIKENAVCEVEEDE